MVKDRSARVALIVGALVVVGGAAAFGQTEQGQGSETIVPVTSRAAAVNGTSTLVGVASPGTIEVDGGVIRVRDNELVTIEASSDSRVAGRATIAVNYDAYADQSGLPGATQVRYGRMRLENEGGAWVGHFAGSLANGGFVQTYWLEGEGAYEGLSYVVTAGGNGNTWLSQGLIFPGDIPPLGGGASLPVDAIGRDLPAALAPGS